MIGLWPVTALTALDAQLADGDDRSVRAFAHRIGARAVAGDFDLPNVNRPEDMDRLT